MISLPWLNILVQAEEIHGVVLILQRREPLVLLFAVGSHDPVRSLCHQEVHVHSACCEGLHRVP